MSQPTPYARLYHFESELGTEHGTHLDNEFGAVKATLDETLANLALVQRDDGYIRNQTVHSYAFSSDALALMAANGSSQSSPWIPVGMWATATLYHVREIVEHSDGKSYVCTTQHTSGTFATDHAAGKWIVLSAPRTLNSADVTTALGFTPVNKAGDTMTGALTIPSGSKIGGASGIAWTDSYLATQDLMRVDKGIFSNYTSTKSDIVYGFAANIFRTSGNFYTVGAQIAAIDTAADASSAWGIACEAWNIQSTTAGVVGIEATAVSLRHDNTGNKFGAFLTFKNRSDGQTVPGAYSLSTPGGTFSSGGSGLGSNSYNRYSRAVYIDSQPRTASGEYCGWAVGIYFAANSLDYSLDGAAIGIDFSNLNYYGGTDPVVAYRMEAAIALRDLQPIWWNRDPAAPSSPAKVKTYFDPTTSRWKLMNGSNERFAVDVATGIAYANGVAISGGGSGASLSANNTWTGTNTFQAAVTVAANLTMSGAARRIQGDFSNATVANRTIFQGSTLNQATELVAIPNGTATAAGFNFITDSAAANGVLGRVAVDTSGVSIQSNVLGAGAYAPITFFTSGSEAMRVSTTNRQLLIGTTSEHAASSVRLRVNGIIACDNPVAFSAHRAGVGFNVANNSVTVVDFTTEEYDTNSSFDTATDRFTPPLGKYHLTGCVRTTAGVDNGSIVVMVYKNGVQYKSGNFELVGGTNAGGSVVSCIVDANGTDYFDLRVIQVNSTLSTLTFDGSSTDCYFQGHRIG